MTPTRPMCPSLLAIGRAAFFVTVLALGTPACVPRDTPNTARNAATITLPEEEVMPTEARGPVEVQITGTAGTATRRGLLTPADATALCELLRTCRWEKVERPADEIFCDKADIYILAAGGSTGHKRVLVRVWWDVPQPAMSASGSMECFDADAVTRVKKLVLGAAMMPAPPRCAGGD